MTAPTITLLGWAALATALLTIELLALRAPGRHAPTLGDLLDTFMRTTSGRWLFLLGWLWLGWHLFVR